MTEYIDYRRRLPQGAGIKAYYWTLCLLGVAGYFVGSVWGQDTSKPVDQKDKRLGERLIRHAVQDTDEDLMAAIVRLMDESAKQLEIEFDAGEETQIKQDLIVKKLDEVIKAAAAQRRMRRSRQKQWQGDQRKRLKQRRRQDQQTQPSADQASGSSSSDVAKDQGAPIDNDAEGGRLYETRRAWGLLPQRQREEVIQGSREAFLERYRQWIERYYQALQESDQ